MSLIPKLLAACLASSAALASTANAAVILSTYPAKSEGYAYTLSSNAWETIGFRTGAIGLDVDAITLRLAGASPGMVSVAVYESTKSPLRQCGISFGQPTYCQYNAPGTVVGSQANTLVSTKDDYTFAFSDVTLHSNSLYWIVIKGMGPSTFKLFENAYDPSLFDPKTSYYNWQAMYRSDVGSTIYDFASSPGVSCVGIPCVAPVLGVDWQYHSGLDMIAINGSESNVPEPASITLILAGLACLFGARRRLAS